MSRKSDEQWEKVMKLIEEIESVGRRRLRHSEKMLIEKLMDELSHKDLSGTDLTTIVNKVFDTFERNELKPIIEFVAKEIVKTVEAISKYFQLQVTGKNAIQASLAAETKIIKAFGIERTKSSIAITAGGYLDNLISNTQTRNHIQKIVLDAVFGGNPFSDMIKNISSYITGTGKIEGALLRHFKSMVFDIVSVAARAQENMIAKDLKMQAFIYVGKILDTSRCFCRKRKGLVFLVSEALEEWPQLVNETCGPVWSKNLIYNPLENMGGHGCIDHLRYISIPEALRRDSTIKLNPDTNQLYRVAA